MTRGSDERVQPEEAGREPSLRLKDRKSLHPCPMDQKQVAAFMLPVTSSLLQGASAPSGRSATREAGLSSSHHHQGDPTAGARGDSYSSAQGRRLDAASQVPNGSGKKAQPLSTLATEGAMVCPEPGCGKVFGTRWGLTRHTRTHTGEKPFECPEPGCGKTFIEKCAMQRHAATHLNHKSFICTVPSCGRAFKTKEYLDVHKNTHRQGRQQYLCLISGCSKVYSTSKGLRKHINSAHAASSQQQHPQDDDEEGEEGEDGPHHPLFTMASATSPSPSQLQPPSREQQLRERLVKLSRRHKSKIARLERKNERLLRLVRSLHAKLKRLQGVEEGRDGSSERKRRRTGGRGREVEDEDEEEERVTRILNRLSAARPVSFGGDYTAGSSGGGHDFGEDDGESGEEEGQDEEEYLQMLGASSSSSSSGEEDSEDEEESDDEEEEEDDDDDEEDEGPGGSDADGSGRVYGLGGVGQ